MPLTRSVGGVNLGAFNRIVRAAALSGILAGLLLTAVQQFQVSKIILQAETYESAAAAVSKGEPAHAGTVRHVHADGHAHTHEVALPPSALEYSHDAQHAHAQAGWQPENGAERTFLTALANISMAVGFGLLLTGAISLHGRASGLRAGLLWGAAAYLVFFVAPSIGLPPELPGTAAAPLAVRQMWWLTTVAATAGGLSLLAFARGAALKLLGAVVLFAPHVVGAPQPEVHASAAPAELARAFVFATALANAAFWLALGALAGFFYKKSA